MANHNKFTSNDIFSHFSPMVFWQVDFDRNAHLSIRKITQRKLRRMCLEYEKGKEEQKKMDDGRRLEEMIREEKERRQREDRERVMRALLRAERRQRMVYLFLLWNWDNCSG